MIHRIISVALVALSVQLSVAHQTPNKLVPLKTLHTSLTDTKGHHMLLRGINLGGWFVEELWMTPFEAQKDPSGTTPQVQDHVSLWAAVEKNLGHDAMLRIRERYRESWITNDDFARIRAAGFNSVRLPILSSLVDEPATAFCRSGLAWIHTAVNLARANGLYVVLDLHGAPGGQSNADHTGQVNQNQLWYGWKNIPNLEAVWKQLAAEFKGDIAVPMFDILNEPMGAYNNAVQYIVFDRAIRSIRTVDPDKIVIVEDGYHGLGDSPNPDGPGWTSVAYSVHQYNFGAKVAQDQIDALNSNVSWWQQLIVWRDSPMYLGEFSAEPYGTPDTVKAMISIMEKQNWSWATWTYKTMAPGGPMGMWGLYSYPTSVEPIHPFTDSEKAMTAKLVEVSTSKMTNPPGLLEMYKSLPALH